MFVARDKREAVRYSPIPGQLCPGCKNEITFAPVSGDAVESPEGFSILKFHCEFCGAASEVLARPSEKS